LIRQALANTDARIRQGKPVTPAFLFAALLWPALPARVAQLQETGKLIRQALANTDARIRQGKPVTPAFLFAALLWPALPARVAQ
ncbi:hypothetical protein RXP09_28875, partial [Pseudomonas aeruginosa]|nr:hypothetical protein [Pseudomonas aeruginosa]MEB4883792.1 hypothetical protein [Pseudomonas aeruginosa]